MVTFAQAAVQGLVFHLLLTAYWEALDFELPATGGEDENGWRRWIDTALETPNDIVAWGDAPAVPGPTYRVEPRSVAVLLTRAHRGSDTSPVAN